MAFAVLSCAQPAPKPPQPQPSAPPPPVPPKPPVCLVLSVGAEEGLAHIGVVRAVQAHGVPIDCVVGTSMGAMVGGLFAARPAADPADGYRQIATRYVDRSKDAAAGSALLGAVLIGLITGNAGTGTIRWERLRDVLREHYNGATIESLPMRYGTVHQQLTTSGAQTVAVQGGLLADQIAFSIANPLVFSDLNAKPGQKLDPGLDRVSAVPVEAACQMFPGRQLLVSNVTNEEIFTSRSMSCPYQQVRVPDLSVDALQAMSAEEPAFSQLVATGYAAAEQQVDWTLLPSAAEPPANVGSNAVPVQSVHTTLIVEVAEQKPSGNAWDVFGGRPDIRQKTTISACAGCDGFGTSAHQPGLSGLAQDTLRGSWDFGVLRLRPGMVFDVEIVDQDIADDDPVGAFRLVFDRPGTEAIAQNASARVVLRFDSAAEHP